MKRRHLAALAMAAAVIALALALVLSPTAHAGLNEPRPIRIGAIYMLTGAGANLGENTSRGAQLAVEEINAGGGVLGRELELVVEDNGSDEPAKALSALQKLRFEGIDIVLGPTWSSTALALAPVACDTSTLVIAPGVGVSGFTAQCDYLFKTWPNDDIPSAALAERVYAEGHRKIAIVSSRQVWEFEQGETVKKRFEELGGQVAVYEVLPEGDKDFRAAAAKIRDANLGAVVLTAYVFEDRAGVTLAEFGYEGALYSVLVDEERIRNAYGTLEGMVVVSSNTPSDAFKKKYLARFGSSNYTLADTSYDTVYLLKEAMASTGSTEPAVLKEYLNRKYAAGDARFSGASGEIAFDKTGSAVKDPVFEVVQGERTVPYTGLP